ncbi:MAG: nuclear transport factor 2 family protein [Planctomycetota bacterium]
MDFVDAFNARDLDALAACLATDASAVVDGSPFPVERGRDAIRDTSLAYLLDREKELTARAADHPDAQVLLLDTAGRLDVAVALERSADGLLVSLTYFTMPHRPEIVAAIASACDLQPAPE